MGQFSFACSACGDKEQFDWTDEVVVALKNQKTGEIAHVTGRYGSYGDVYIDVSESRENHPVPVGSMPVYPKQFEDLFDCWGHHDHEHIGAEEIYCHGEYSRYEMRPKPKKVVQPAPPCKKSKRANAKLEVQQEDSDDDEEVRVTGCRMCVPENTAVIDALPIDFAFELGMWNGNGYERLGPPRLSKMLGPPGAGGMDPGCSVM